MVVKRVFVLFYIQIAALRSSTSGSDQKIIQLQDEIEELTVWKEKVRD